MKRYLLMPVRTRVFLFDVSGTDSFEISVEFFEQPQQDNTIKEFDLPGRKPREPRRSLGRRYLERLRYELMVFEFNVSSIRSSQISAEFFGQSKQDKCHKGVRSVGGRRTQDRSLLCCLTVSPDLISTARNSFYF